MKPLNRTRVATLSVTVLLAFHYTLAVGSKLEHSTTSDELVHLTGGYTYWRFNDYRLHPENGNLPQRWAALPAWLGGTTPPPTADSDYWRTSNSWMVGYLFFYGSGNDHFPWLIAGRAMIALFSVGTGILIFLWSRNLWGCAGAVVAASFFSLCPNFLAHGALVTSDVCMTFFFLASVGAYWRHLHNGKWSTWVLSTIVFGFACVAKFSAVLILPMMAIMAVARILNKEVLRFGGSEFYSKSAKSLAVLALTAGHGIAAIAVIWLFFGFRYEAFNPDLSPADHFIRPWDLVISSIGTQGTVISFMNSLRMLPEAFLYGYAYTLESVISRSAFLNGEYSINGWIRFFPLAFIYKTPLPTLIAIGGLCLLAILKWRSMLPRLYRLTPLLSLFGVYWAASLTSNLNIGHRHILPTYPVLFILFGSLGNAAASTITKGVRASMVPLLSLISGIGWLALDSITSRPHYLAYFNLIAGGPSNGYKRLVDSSLDWGQDLPGLKDWLAQNRRPDERVYLSYFGTSVPDYYGFDVIAMPTINEFEKPRPWYWMEPGIYAVSATMLQHVYMPKRGPWTAEDEATYQALHSLSPQFRMLKEKPYGHPELFTEAGPLEWARRWRLYDQFRFARLCHYLRARDPDAMIGFSILIFRLDQRELDQALHGSIRDPMIEVDRVGSR